MGRRPLDGKCDGRSNCGRYGRDAQDVQETAFGDALRSGTGLSRGEREGMDGTIVLTYGGVNMWSMGGFGLSALWD